MSVREYAVLYLGGTKGGAGGSAGGGNVLVTTGTHALDGVEHSGAADSTRLDATATAHGLLPKLSGDAAEVLLGDGTWGALAAGDLPWYDVQVDGACVGDGATDDTAALQAAIDAATANGTQSATLYFPPGVYLIGGALQDTGDFNGQILFPDVALTSPQITIKFLGAARPPMQPQGPLPDPGGYTILKSTLTGASGTAAVFSGGQYGDWTNVSIVLQDLMCEAPDNPTMTFWNLDTCQGGSLSNVMVWASGCWAGAAPVEPTHSNSYAIKLPHYGESNYTYVDGLVIAGWYTGIRHTDLAISKGIGFGWCHIAVEIPEHQHASMIISMHCSATQIPIKVTGDAYCDVLFASVEHNVNPPFPAWVVTTYDLDDPSDYLHGHIRWFGWRLDTALPDHTFTVNGGANASHAEIGALSGGTPASTVESETTWGIAAAVGSDTQYARQDHTHGTPSTDEVRDAGRWEVVMADHVDLNVGTFATSVNQTVGSTTTAYAVAFDVTLDNDGLVHSDSVDNSHIGVTTAGEYLVSVSAIADANAAGKHMDIWLALDGTNIADSGTRAELVANAESIMAVSYVLDLHPGQYLQVMYAGDSTGCRFLTTAAAASPTRPRSPAVVVAVSLVIPDTGSAGDLPQPLASEDGTDWLYAWITD